MRAFYNEIDTYCCDWLSNLMDAGHITPGVICDKSIEDVFPDELRGFDRCHFFAGIGVWDYALNLAGWGERPVWTGSAPCQPFSAAGKGAGFADERHLWPAFHWLIKQCRPPVLFGEQVASKIVDDWLDVVSSDLEGVGFAIGAVAFPSAGVGAPHIRDRAYFMAHADNARSQGRQRVRERAAERSARKGGVVGIVADADGRQRDGISVIRGVERDGADAGRPQGGSEPESCGAVCELADADVGTCGQGSPLDGGRDSRGDAIARAGSRGNGLPDGFERIEPAGPTNGFWQAADWLLCRDEKWRPVRPGSFPLADGAPSRVGRLRAYGNAINAQAAAEFIRAAEEAMTDQTNRSTK